jgi:hypothetical protein
MYARLVVEVVSPNDPFAEVEDKVFDWLQYGAQMVVVVSRRRELLPCIDLQRISHIWTKQCFGWSQYCSRMAAAIGGAICLMCAVGRSSSGTL